MIYLVVRQAFAPYSVGSLITDQTTVNAILSGPNVALVEALYAKYVGDTWLWNIAVTNADGTVANISGQQVAGELFVPFQATPSDLTVANGSVVIIDSSHFLVRVDKSLTQTIPGNLPAPPSLPCGPRTVPPSPPRVQIFLTDGSSNRTTIGVLPIFPLKP